MHAGAGVGARGAARANQGSTSSIWPHSLQPVHGAEASQNGGPRVHVRRPLWLNLPSHPSFLLTLVLPTLVPLNIADLVFVPTPAGLLYLLSSTPHLVRWGRPAS